MPNWNQPYSKLYKTKRWRELRLRVFARYLNKCQMCGGTFRTEDLVADHKQAHRNNDESLFWDENNIQPLCHPCHDGPKQRQEQSSLNTRGVWY